MPASDAEIERLRRNQCPTCGNYGFLAGPRGGAGQNIFCANPDCRTGYLIAPRNNIQLAERLDTKGPDNLYPPLVHVLARGGLPLCNFAGSITVDNGPPARVVATSPDAWPIGHDWVERRHFERATCRLCREKGRNG